MPPVSIKRFEKLLVASTALLFAATLIDYTAVQERAIGSEPWLEGPVAEIVINLLISLFFWFFIVRRASNVVKWIWVVLTALGLALLPWIYSDFVGVSTTYALLNGLSFVIGLVATALLFTRESIVWLKSNGALAPIDPDVFS
jgi:hypothetical protein